MNEKELRFIDLSYRIPYRTICASKRFDKCVLVGIDDDGATFKHINCLGQTEYELLDIIEFDVQPYLRPMSSMTAEERKEFSKLLDKRCCEEDWEGHISISYCIEIDNVYTDDENGIKYPSAFSMDAIDWLNAHHFDYRGLIEKGLAIEVAEENNPYKE